MRLRALLVPLVLLPALVLSKNASAQQGPPPGKGSPCAPGGPAANGYPPNECGLALGKSKVEPGDSVQVGGAGFEPNSRVALEFRSTPAPLGFIQTDEAGSFSTTVVIPETAPEGAHHIAAVGADPTGRAFELASSVTVDLEPSGSARSAGTDPTARAAKAAAAVALMGLGGLAVLISRRKRTVA